MFGDWRTGCGATNVWTGSTIWTGLGLMKFWIGRKFGFMKFELIGCSGAVPSGIVAEKAPPMKGSRSFMLVTSGISWLGYIEKTTAMGGN